MTLTPDETLDADIARNRPMAGTEPPQVHQVGAGVHQVTPMPTDGSSSSITISTSARKPLGAVCGGREQQQERQMTTRAEELRKMAKANTCDCEDCSERRTMLLDFAAALEEIERLTKDADALRAALIKARDAIRDPDYCYDEEWEYTTAWTEWPDLMDGYDLTEPTPLYTLYKGPTKWVVRVTTDDDSELRLFGSEAEARAALTPKESS
jgi:hypothetical protein